MAVNFKELQKQVKVLNTCEAVKELDLKKVVTKGKTEEEVIEAFASLVEQVDEAGETLPESVIAVYNTISEEEEEPEEESEESEEEEETPEEEKTEEEEEEKVAEKKKEAKKKAPAKKAAPKKETKKKAPAKKEAPKKETPKKENKGNLPKERGDVTRYGSYAGSQSGIMDDLLNKGATLNELMEAAGAKKERVHRHLRKLKRKGLTVVETPNKSDAKNPKFKVKESKLES